MNIGYFIRKDWFPPKAGSTIHAYQVATKLMERGHEISTIFCGAGGPGVHAYSKSQLLGFLRDVDVLYVRHAWDTAKMTLLKALTGGATPVVWEVNAPLEERRLFGVTPGQFARLQYYRRRLAPLVDACICNTRTLADYVGNRWGIRRSLVVPLGSDPELFSPRTGLDDSLRPYAGRFKVVWAGTPKYVWQAVEDIVEVARRMATLDPEVVFILIGNLAHLRALAPPSSNVVLVEQKNYIEVPAFLRAGDVGLCLYRDDGLGLPFYRSPLKLFDYMACGMVPIVSDNEETRRVVRHGENGVLVNGDVQEVVDWILQLKRDPGGRRAMCRAAREDVEQYYNWGRVADDTEQILLAALEGREGWRRLMDPVVPAA
ncbi:MAG: glycosyltransferase [Arenicellales bacterium]